MIDPYYAKNKDAYDNKDDVKRKEIKKILFTNIKLFKL